MSLRDKILAIILYAFFAYILVNAPDLKASEAGPFFDFDIGMNIPCDTVKSASMTDYTYSCGQVAQDNPIGIVRAGYQFKSYPVWKLQIQPHAYYEHASSIVTNHERGLNVLMVGVRIQ